MINLCKVAVISETIAPLRHLGGQCGTKRQILCFLGKHVDVVLGIDDKIIERLGICDCDCAQRFRKIRLPHDLAMSLLR